MTIPIARFLAEFALGPTVVEPILLPVQHSEAEPSPEPTAEEIFAARLEDARELWRSEAETGFAAAQAERETALQAAYADELEAERAKWIESEGQVLAARLTARLDELETQVADAAAAVLAPLLPDAVIRRTVDELRDAIGILLSSDDGPAVIVSGRADLVAAIDRSFGGRARLRCEPSETPDVHVRAGETEIRSALAVWTQKLTSIWDADS